MAKMTFNESTVEEATMGWLVVSQPKKLLFLV